MALISNSYFNLPNKCIWYSTDGVSLQFLLYFTLFLKKCACSLTDGARSQFLYFYPSLFICYPFSFYVSFAALYRWRWFPNFYSISVLFSYFLSLSRPQKIISVLLSYYLSLSRPLKINRFTTIQYINNLIHPLYIH